MREAWLLGDSGTLFEVSGWNKWVTSVGHSDRGGVVCVYAMTACRRALSEIDLRPKIDLKDKLL